MDSRDWIMILIAIGISILRHSTIKMEKENEELKKENMELRTGYVKQCSKCKTIVLLKCKCDAGLEEVW